MSILSHHLPNISSKLRQFIPEQPCFLCGAMSRSGLCCAACDADLPRLAAAHCPTCALPTPNGDLCGRCIQHPPHFDRTVAGFSYSFPINQLIKALKFNEQLVLVNFLADEVASQVRIRPDYLLALPLHPLRLSERGFNQSQLLAARIAKKLDIPLLNDACARVRDTPPQSSLPWKERDKNMRQAFSVTTKIDLQNKHLAIVDDVLTTGASIGALAATFKQAGCAEVSAWVMARTLPHHEGNE